MFDYQTGISTYKGDGFNQVNVGIILSKQTLLVTNFIFFHVLLINICFIREWAGSGRKVKNEATPQKGTKFSLLMFAFSWACHTLDQDGVTESRKIYVHGQVKQNSVAFSN